MNLPRLIGDSTHLIAVLLLIWKICRNKSCSGISGRTQILYFIVFCTRYLDIFTNFVSYYNTFGKAFFIISTLCTLLLIYVKFKTTVEKHDNFKIQYLVLLTLIAALIINFVSYELVIFDKLHYKLTYEFTVINVLWTFSIYLEALAIIPQLTLVIKNGEVDPTVFYYICGLFSYRAFYIINWIWRYYTENFYDASVPAGCIQTSLYIPFFYLYHRKVIQQEELLILPD